jgi:hypothetical protein
MNSVATHVLTTVNAPYGANLSASQLAALVVTEPGASEISGPAFSFFSDVSLPAQKHFLKAMGVDEAKAGKVAGQFSKLSGFPLPLAA